MTVQDQLTAIRGATFFSDLHAKVKSVASSMTNAGMSVQDSYTITVDTVSVKITPGPDDTTVYAGLADDGATPLYTWRLPTNWMVS